MRPHSPTLSNLKGKLRIKSGRHRCQGAHSGASCRDDLGKAQRHCGHSQRPPCHKHPKEDAETATNTRRKMQKLLEMGGSPSRGPHGTASLPCRVPVGPAGKRKIYSRGAAVARTDVRVLSAGTGLREGHNRALQSKVTLGLQVPLSAEDRDAGRNS